jgi:hypothetical protein
MLLIFIVGTKLNLFKMTFVPIVIYGYESWPLSSKHYSQLQATEMRHLRKIEEKI